MIARDLGLSLLIVVAGLMLAFMALQTRRAWLFRRGATVACAVRSSTGRSWQGGVCRFDPDAMRAYRVVGVGVRPYAELNRSDLALGDRRLPDQDERRRLMQDPVVVSVSNGADEMELALGRSALTGLLAWVEGRPVS